MNRALLGLALLACALGLFFTSYSTFDFVQHLDRQVHGIHCSFIPGLEGTDVSGTSGCHVTLMSPYSSVMRDVVWGGVPISLPGMAVFAFLLAYGLRILVREEDGNPAVTGFYALATCLPVLTSAGMGYLSLVTLDAACKLCIGTYTASGLAFVGAVGLWRSSQKPRWSDPDLDDDLPALTPPNHPLAFASGVAFVALAVGGYVLLAPDFSGYIGECGELAAPEDTYGILLPLGPQGGAQAIEVLDPLCPSCRGLEERLAASGLGVRLARQAALFPLDNACNWMVSSAVHPGACALSEALLCAASGQAGAGVEDVLAWSFDNQDVIKEASISDPAAAERLVVDRFPKLDRCVGSPKIKTKLNQSLRWAVANKLPVLTPQLYVEGVKLCDEDTDLGMDFALARLLDARDAGTLRSQ